ncbi:rhodanese-like domain-containing protein [Minwuia sp.]|uniref:rhodanese-like domain-containing protein n=1 Tax=Minwuia sp. TaxID=2493630 RepID=UPI003A94E9A6
MSEGYAGDVPPWNAHDALTGDRNAVLIDVRTVPEWQFVGIPDLSGMAKDTLFIEWQHYPEMKINESFVEDVRAKGISEDQPIYLLCRSGVRSKAAAKALTAAGYRFCYNVSEGFEGDKDDTGRRGNLGGWRYHDLPWKQQ